MTEHLLLTGASGGIGRALALHLAKAGYRLSLHGRDATKLAETCAQVLALAPATQPAAQLVHQAAFDLTDAAALIAFCQQAEAACPVDGLINCAGANLSRAPAQNPDWPALEQMLALNFRAPLLLQECLLPGMLARGHGTILQVLSTCVSFANPGVAAYSASKSALESYSKVLRRELQDSGVRVLHLIPGGVDTGFRPQARPEYLTPDDVATAALAMLQAPQSAHWHELVLRPQVERNWA
jgi:short-subunit dehydrogenase